MQAPLKKKLEGRERHMAVYQPSSSFEGWQENNNEFVFQRGVQKVFTTARITLI